MGAKQRIANEATVIGLGVKLGFAPISFSLSPPGGGGVGGTQQSFVQGGTAPRSNPVPLFYTIFETMVPL